MSDRYDELLMKMVHIISRRLEGVDLRGIESLENFLPWMETYEPKMAAEERRLEREVGRRNGGEYAEFRGAVVKYSRHLTAMIERYKKVIKTGPSALMPEKAEKRPLQPIPEAGQEWHGAGQRPREGQKELF